MTELVVLTVSPVLQRALLKSSLTLTRVEEKWDTRRTGLPNNTTVILEAHGTVLIKMQSRSKRN